MRKWAACAAASGLSSAWEQQQYHWPWTPEILRQQGAGAPEDKPTRDDEDEVKNTDKINVDHFYAYCNQNKDIS